MPNQEYKYSNGLDLIKVLPALRDRIKWLSEIATPSTSGRYFDDGSFHAIVSESLLKSTQPNAAIDNTAFTSYKAAWKDGVIMRVLDAVFTKEEIIEQTLLYEILEQRGIPELPAADFVGYEISVPADINFSLQILNAVFQFDNDTMLKFYVYADGETDPFWQSPAAVNITGGKYSIINLDKCILSYSEKKVTKFYCGYKPSDITGGAKPLINDILCRRDTAVFNAEEIHATFPLLTTNIKYPYGRTGLNLEIKSFNDFTQKIISSPSSFDSLIGLVNAAQLMEQAVFAKRINPDQRQATADPIDKFAVQLELTGTLPINDAPQIFGIRSKIAKQAEKVRKSFIDQNTGVTSLC